MGTRVPVISTDKDTFLHRRDPRAKVLLLIASFIFIFAAPDWRWMLGYAIVGALIAAVARVPRTWLLLVAVAQVPNVLGLLGLPLLLSWLFEGGVAFGSTLQLGIFLSLAWVGTLLFSLGLFSTMRIEELCDGLRGLKMPESAAFVVQYAFMLLYTSLSDILRIIDAMKLKGLHLETRNPLPYIRALPRLMIPAIFTVVRRANTMMSVLQLRGLAGGRTRRTTVALGRFRAADGAVVALGVGVVAVTVAVNVGAWPSVALG